MASIFAVSETRRDQIRIFINTREPVPARDVGRMLVSLDRAFSKFAREQTGRTGFRLEVVQSGAGSWWVVVQAAYGAYDVAKEFPEVVPFFMHNLDVVIKSILAHGIDDTPKHMRELVRNIAKTGKGAVADTIEIMSITRILLDKDAFYELDVPQVREPSPPKKEPLPSLDWSAAATLLRDDASLKAAADLAKDGNLSGTLFKVAGSWFARAEGMNGVLLPLELNMLATLAAVDNRGYRIEGTLKRSPEGYPVGIKVKNLTWLRAPDDPLLLA